VSAVFVTFTGCSGSSDTPDTSDRPTETPRATETPQPTETSRDTESATRSAAAATEPEPGTCWKVPAAAFSDTNYWFDDSARVPCTDPHSTETVVTYSLAEPTIDEAKRLAHYCWGDVHDYLGIDETNWIPWGWAAFLPSKEEVAAGAGWMRCDVYFPTTTHNSSARMIDVSAKGIADAPPADFWACTDKSPAKADQPFVSCGQPHKYEQTGTLAIMDGIIDYPSATERATEAQRQCRDGVPAGYDNVSVNAEWDPRSDFVAGSGIAGRCFMFYPDGRALPAR